MHKHQLQRVLGAPTALLIGMGVAIGSGIFRTPGEVAAKIQTPWLIIAAWILGGLIILMQGMVTAELATRYPTAGGEYVYLREAYGRFVAFFFGWSYTIFVIGGGVATIAAAFGDFSCELFGLSGKYAGPAAAVAILLVIGINAVGVRAGAAAQNVMTVIKIVALLAIGVLGLVYGNGTPSQPVASVAAPAASSVVLFFGAILPILWSYSGTTDPVKMAEEVRGVRRAMPLACIGSAVALIALYVVFNLALMRIVPPAEMQGLESVPGEAMYRLFGDTGRASALVLGMVVCLGALSSTIFALIRVTFALARDGLAFRFMAHMSASQAPVPALLVVGGFAIFLVLTRRFMQVLDMYFFASAFLFGLVYASLIVFRVRDRHRPLATEVYRCPLGIFQAGFLIVFYLCLAANIAIGSPKDMLYTALILVAVGLLYLVWRRVVPMRDGAPMHSAEDEE